MEEDWLMQLLHTHIASAFSDYYNIPLEDIIVQELSMKNIS